MENKKYVNLFIFFVIGVASIYFFYTFDSPQPYFKKKIGENSVYEEVEEENTRTICLVQETDAYDALLEIQNKSARVPFEKFKKEHANDFSP